MEKGNRALAFKQGGLSVGMHQRQSGKHSRHTGFQGAVPWALLPTVKPSQLAASSAGYGAC